MASKGAGKQAAQKVNLEVLRKCKTGSWFVALYTKEKQAGTLGIRYKKLTLL
jgi:hypothetical protein